MRLQIKAPLVNLVSKILKFLRRMKVMLDKKLVETGKNTQLQNGEG